MKKTELRQLIKEEIESILKEETYPEGWNDKLEKQYQQSLQAYMDGQSNNRPDREKMINKYKNPNNFKQNIKNQWDDYLRGGTSPKPKI